MICIFCRELSHDHENEWNERSSFGKIARRRKRNKSDGLMNAATTTTMSNLYNNGKRCVCTKQPTELLLYFRCMSFFFSAELSVANSMNSTDRCRCCRRRRHHLRCRFNTLLGECVRVLLKAIFMFRCHRATREARSRTRKEKALRYLSLLNCLPSVFSLSLSRSAVPLFPSRFV